MGLRRKPCRKASRHRWVVQHIELGESKISDNWLVAILVERCSRCGATRTRKEGW